MILILDIKEAEKYDVDCIGEQKREDEFEPALPDSEISLLLFVLVWYGFF